MGAEAAWVLLHGMLGAPGMFDPVLAALTRSGVRPVRVVTPVLPGHGSAPWGLEARSFDEALEGLSARLPAGALHVAGYSLGARLAVGLALREPQRFPRVVAIGAHLGLDPGPEREARRGWELRMAALVRAEGQAALVDVWEKMDLFASQTRLPADVLVRQRQARLAHAPAGVAWAFEVLGTGVMPPLCSSRPASGVTITWVAGALDDRFSAIARAASARGLGEAVLVPGAGHNVPLEAPDALALVLAKHLDAAQGERHPGASSHDEQRGVSS